VHGLPSTSSIHSSCARPLLRKIRETTCTKLYIKTLPIPLNHPAVIHLSRLDLHNYTDHHNYYISPLILARHVLITSQIVQPWWQLPLLGSYQERDAHTTTAFAVRARGALDALQLSPEDTDTVTSGFTSVESGVRTDAPVSTAADGPVLLDVIRVDHIFGFEFSGYLYALQTGRGHNSRARGYFIDEEEAYLEPKITVLSHAWYRQISVPRKWYGKFFPARLASPFVRTSDSY
jgi:hypothetical protein